MPTVRLYAHPDVSEDFGRVAIKRGPLVYCAEEADLGFPPQRLRLPAEAAFKASFAEDLLGGAIVLTCDALAADETNWGNGLYSKSKARMMETTLTAIPYHLWANRQKGDMMVWLQEEA